MYLFVEFGCKPETSCKHLISCASSHNCDGFVCMLEGRSESLVNVHEYEGHEEEKLLMREF
jgi:hypothetical protein